MNLIVDSGNTSIKLAVFENNELLYDASAQEASFSNILKKLLKRYARITNAILASVKPLSRTNRALLSVFCEVYELGPASRVPYKNSYATPQTLGVDRMALATAAYCSYPKTNVLVIDVGTCVTYDMVNAYGEYLGGAISPGLYMRYWALNARTAKLPLLQPEEILDFIGNSTETSIQSGVVNGLAREIDGVIEQYASRFPNLTVILTGGDSQFLSKQLKNPIFAKPKFLLLGLNFLLEYNKRK